MVLLGIRTDGLIQIDPSLPHIGGVVHVVHATDHVTLGLRDTKLARVLRNTVTGAILLVVVVLGLIGKAIPLPVVHAIFILELVDALSVPLEISTIGHVNRPTSLHADVLRLQGVGNRPLGAIAAARADPCTEVRTEVLNQFGGRCKSVGELAIELPETGVGRVVGPTIVNNIRIERAKLRAAHLAVDLGKRAQNGLVADVLLVVVPGVVLNTELRRCGDVIDVIEEVRLDNSIIFSGCRAHNRGPRRIMNAAVLGAACLLIRGKAGHRLAGVVARTTDLLVPILGHDLGIRRRELATEEHAVGVERLADNSALHRGANDGALVGRDGPLTLGVRHVERLEIDIVNLSVQLVLFGNGDLQILAHVVIAVVSHDVLGDGIGRAVELNRLELEGQLLTGLLLLIDGGGSVAHDRLAIKLKLARLEEHVGLNGLNPLLGVEIKLLTAGKLLSVLASPRLKHDALNTLAGVNLIIGDIDVNRLAPVPLIVKGAVHHLGPAGGSMVSVD